MKLVVDMNLSGDWADALQQDGFDAVHWAAIGPEGADDRVILNWARENDAVVLTRDLDFAAAISMLDLSSPSVIQLRIVQARPERHLPLVRRALSLHRDDLDRGAIVTIEEERIRIRKLSPRT